MAPALASRLAGSHLHLRLIGRRTLARRPQLWVYALAAVAATLLLDAVLSAGATASTEHGAWLAAWSEWMLMVLAMMLPVIAPEARQVAMRSLWRRRHRAMLGYLSGYVSVWALVGLPIVGAIHGGAHHSHPPAGVTVVALLCAALWQTSRPRLRIMRRCGSVQIGAAQGLAADRDCAVAGWRAGLLCALTCGPVMLVMAVGHDFGLMAGLLALLLTERARGPNPARRTGRPLEAWCLAGYAALLTVVALG